MTHYPEERFADLIALNAARQPVMLVTVKAQPMEEQWQIYDRAELEEYLCRSDQAIPFAMIVYRDHMLVFRWDSEKLRPALPPLDTADILSHYEPEFRHKEIYADYLGALAEAWLRDIAYHWKTDVPPASESLQGIGLAGLLQGGAMLSERALAA